MIVNSQDNIDDDIVTGFDLKDLNIKDIALFRSLLPLDQQDKYINDTIENFLIEIGALRRIRNISETKYGVTVGCLLFFGNYTSISEKFPHFQIDYFKKHNSLDTNWLDRVSPGDKDYPNMNLFSFYLLVIEKLQASVESTFEVTEMLNRDSFKSDISLALREALTNTIAHAYYDSKSSIKIYDYDDYWEFFNPGKMKISKIDFIKGGNPISRNSIIPTLFRRAGFGEKAGSGGPRIYDSTKKHKLKPPEILLTENSTTIRIWKKDTLSYYDNRLLSEKKIIKKIFEKNEINKSTAIEELGLTSWEFRNAIKLLLKDEIIIQTGKGKSTSYTFNYSEEALIQSKKKQLINLQDNLNT